MKSYTKLLAEKSSESNCIACLGMDPVIERIPVNEKNAEKKIFRFYSDIINAAVSENAIPAAVKPNYAFYAQYGFPGLRALKKVIRLCKSNDLIVILDAKRGDTGSTGQAYAREAFDFWKADAVTVSPYMGFDSVEPFIEWCKKGKGVYMLVRTSNKGAADFQELDCTGKKWYMRAAEKLVEWHVDGVCAVIGATNISELGEIQNFFVSSGRNVPFLIPGVGSQGGSAKEVSAVLKANDSNNVSMHRINSSSGINYAYERFNSDDYAGSAVKALKELINETGGNNVS